MTEVSPTPRNESTNWLTIFPTDNEREKTLLNELRQTLGDFPDTQEIVLGVNEAIETRAINGKKLRDEDIAFFKKFFEYISQGVALGLDEAVSLRNRQVTDNELKRREKEKAGADQSVEKWSFFSGDYRGSLIHEAMGDTSLQEMKEEEYIPHERPGDTVHFLKKRLEQLLKLEREQPVVLVDIGAMYGSTLLELAPLFQDEIMAGKLVLIATNISLNKEIIQNTPKPKSGMNLYQNYEQLYAKGHELVHFLTTDVKGLVGRKILLPNGQELTLKAGSIDIAHENWSISKHSKAIELDVADLIDMVGPKGMIMSQQRDEAKIRGSGGLKADGERVNKISSGVEELVSMSRAKDFGIWGMQDSFFLKDIGQDRLVRVNQNLAHHGFHLIEKVVDPQTKQKHELNYAFWLGSEAEPLKVYKADGTEIILTTKHESKGLWRKLKNAFVSS